MKGKQSLATSGQKYSFRHEKEKKVKRKKSCTQDALAVKSVVKLEAQKPKSLNSNNA